MSKVRATMKKIKSSAKIVVGVPYCELYHLLKRQNPTMYYANVYGWRCDFYRLSQEIGIVTGYDYDRACDFSLDAKTCQAFDQKASDILKTIKDADARDMALDRLIDEFIDTCKNYQATSK